MNREERRSLRKKLKKGHNLTAPGVQLDPQKYISRYKQRLVAIEDEALQYATWCDQLTEQVNELTMENNLLKAEIKSFQSEPAEPSTDEKPQVEE